MGSNGSWTQQRAHGVCSQPVLPHEGPGGAECTGHISEKWMQLGPDYQLLQGPFLLSSSLDFCGGTAKDPN